MNQIKYFLIFITDTVLGVLPRCVEELFQRTEPTLEIIQISGPQQQDVDHCLNHDGDLVRDLVNRDIQPHQHWQDTGQQILLTGIFRRNNDQDHQKQKEKILLSVLNKIGAPEDIKWRVPDLVTCLNEHSMVTLERLDLIRPGWVVKMLWDNGSLVLPDSNIRMLRDRAIASPLFTDEDIEMVLDFLAPNWRNLH